MANPHKGEVTFTVDDKIYTLRLSVDALVRTERAAGELDGVKRVGFPKIARMLADPETLSLDLARTVFWCALRERHPDLTVERAGDLMMAIGGIAGAIEKLNECFAATFPDPKPGDEANPPKPGQATTGPASAESGAATI